MASTTGTVETGMEIPAVLTEAERSVLVEENDPEDHIEAGLKIGLARLNQAVQAMQTEEFDNVHGSLAAYNQLLSYLECYARQSPMKAKKRDKLFRLMEVKLRHQLPLLEAIARTCPFDEDNNSPEMTLSRVQGLRKQLLNVVFGGDFFKPCESTAINAFKE
ncbi:MAG TPA: hypothetical protein PLB18_02465 [Acidobacteriota bacterium]|nr:hypothetical protein [Acidobacteriota bacterium]HND18206.1 hypothetical protein [Acidobacteriota bacterium]